MLVRLLSLLLALLPFSCADVKFTIPVAGKSVDSGTITVQWQDDSTGKTPLAGLAGYQVFLMVGGKDEATSVNMLSFYRLY